MSLTERTSREIVPWFVVRDASRRRRALPLHPIRLYNVEESHAKTDTTQYQIFLVIVLGLHKCCGTAAQRRRTRSGNRRNTYELKWLKRTRYCLLNIVALYASLLWSIRSVNTGQVGRKHNKSLIISMLLGFGVCRWSIWPSFPYIYHCKKNNLICIITIWKILIFSIFNRNYFKITIQLMLEENFSPNRCVKNCLLLIGNRSLMLSPHASTAAITAANGLHNE